MLSTNIAINLDRIIDGNDCRYQVVWKMNIIPYDDDNWEIDLIIVHGKYTNKNNFVLYQLYPDTGYPSRSIIVNSEHTDEIIRTVQSGDRSVYNKQYWINQAKQFETRVNERSII